MKINGKAALNLTIGTIVNIAIGYAVSYVSFTFLILQLGYILGLILAWLFSFIVFYTMFLFYAWSKKDWIGMGMIKKNLEKNSNKNLITRLLAYAQTKGEILFFIVLSIKLGPFTSLVYMRNPGDYSKMQKRDWRIFLIGFVITNLFCTVVVLLGIAIYKAT